ncbi:MAG TPA: hypothetical protein VMK65_04440, partial [Longimicrobiales bacterium]|nr:hypothetical protein [Longimicrobiales bacterium]
MSSRPRPLASPVPPAPPSRADAAARERRLTEAGLLLMVVLWAVNFSVVKVALEVVEPLTFNALRFPLASLALWLLLRR